MKYKSLTKRYKDQNSREIFAHFPYNGEAGETWETPYERLAHLAKDEDWSFHRSEFLNQYQNQRFPVLTNYLNYTFLRLQEESKIK